MACLLVHGAILAILKFLSLVSLQVSQPEPMQDISSCFPPVPWECLFGETLTFPSRFNLRANRKRSQPRRHKTQDQKSLGDIMEMESALDEVKMEEQIPSLDEEDKSKEGTTQSFCVDSEDG